MSALTPEQRRESFVKRARVSASAGPWLALAGAILVVLGMTLASFHWGVFLVMGIAAVLLQIPRQKAWRTQSDWLEFMSLAAMPLLLLLLCVLWLRLNDALSFGTVLQGLSGFFLVLGVFHVVTRSHTLQLADEIESDH